MADKGGSLAEGEGGNDTAPAQKTSERSPLFSQFTCPPSLSLTETDVTSLSVSLQGLTQTVAELRSEMTSLKKSTDGTLEDPAAKRCRDNDTSFPPAKRRENPLKRRQASTDQNETRGFSIIRKSLQKQGLPKHARDIIIKSWRSSTRKQYQTYLDKWLLFCEGKENPLKPNIANVVAFLTSLYQKGLGYSAVGIARSAVSTFVSLTGGVDIHTNSIVSRFMKGLFNERPALPRYQITWDVAIVLRYLDSMDTNSLLSLSCKLSMLFLLLTAQRCQTLHVLELSDVQICSTELIIQPSHILKQSKPGQHLEPIRLQRYDKNRKLCIVKLMTDYLARTKPLRTGTKLIISTVSPHKAVSKQTIGRWVKLVLQRAGIPCTFKPHSTRAASTSTAKLQGVPVSDIIKSAGWTNAHTFAKYYNKPIPSLENPLQMAVLSKQK